MKTRRLSCVHESMCHVRVEGDEFSHVPTHHVAGGGKVNKFHRHADSVRAFSNGRVISKTQQQPNPIPLNTSSDKTGNKRYKVLLYFQGRTKTKRRSLYAEGCEIVMDTSPSGTKCETKVCWDKVKNNWNYLPLDTWCEALLCKVVLTSGWSHCLWTSVNAFTLLAFSFSTKKPDSY